MFENESYAYYKLSETPAYYITAWYNLLSGKWEFGKVNATETTVEGTTVELNTNGHHATYEMKISGFDLDYKANKVYGELDFVMEAYGYSDKNKKYHIKIFVMVLMISVL